MDSLMIVMIVCATFAFFFVLVLMVSAYVSSQLRYIAETLLVIDKFLAAGHVEHSRKMLMRLAEMARNLAK